MMFVVARRDAFSISDSVLAVEITEQVDTIFGRSDGRIDGCLFYY